MQYKNHKITLIPVDSSPNKMDKLISWQARQIRCHEGRLVLTNLDDTLQVRTNYRTKKCKTKA